MIALQVVRFRTPEEARAPRSEIEVPIDAVGTVVRLELIGGAGRAAGMVRNAQVWLPPGYDDAANAARRYPVLYMLDGQNLFQTPPGGFGEWQADETALRLIEQGTIEPLIIVGIPHAGLFRADEYLPFPWIPGAEPSGGALEAWLLGHVMPRVERAFRVDTGPDRTGIGGSSLGGVMSLFIATHPTLRTPAGRASRWAAPGRRSAATSTRQRPGRAGLLGMGGREGRVISRRAMPSTSSGLVGRAAGGWRRVAPEVMLRVVPDHTLRMPGPSGSLRQPSSCSPPASVAAAAGSARSDRNAVGYLGTPGCAGNPPFGVVVLAISILAVIGRFGRTPIGRIRPERWFPRSCAEKNFVGLRPDRVATRPTRPASDPGGPPPVWWHLLLAGSSVPRSRRAQSGGPACSAWS